MKTQRSSREPSLRQTSVLFRKSIVAAIWKPFQMSTATHWDEEYRNTAADPEFFLGGGAPPRNDLTDGEVKKIKSEYVYTKKKASSQGEVRIPCTLP